MNNAIRCLFQKVKHLNDLPHADDISWSMNVGESKKKQLVLQNILYIIGRMKLQKSSRDACLEHVGFTIYVEPKWKPIQFNVFHQNINL